MASRWCDWRRIGRLARLALALALLAGALILIPPWIPVFLTSTRIRAMAIGLLVGLRIAYGAVLAVSLIGAIVLGVIFRSARRRRVRRPMVARGLLLCCTCLIGLAVSEAIAAAAARPVRSMPATPAVSPRDPELPREFAESDDHEVTLVVIGESSAAGVPYEKWLSVGQIVAWQLGEVMPGRRFRALVLASPGATLEAQYHDLAGLRRRPDAVVVYCGHNEFTARIPWSRKVPYYRDDEPEISKSHARFAGSSTPVCGLIERALEGYRIETVPPSSFNPLLVDGPVYTAKEFAAILSDFRRRLEAIVAFTERVGALPILVVPPGNDAGFEPSRSFLRADTPRREREAFAVDFLAARQLEDSDPACSRKAYHILLARQPGFAECHYRLARLLEKTGAWDEAYQQYIAARDLDGMPLRCLTVFQQAYFDVAKLHDCVFVDGQALFHTVGPHGLLDDTLFNDVVHPSLRGHIAIASGILDALRARGALGWPPGVPTPTIELERCVAQFELHSIDWKTVCGGLRMFYWAAGNRPYDPRQCRGKERAYQEAVRRIRAGEAPESLGLCNVGIPPALSAPSLFH